MFDSYNLAACQTLPLAYIKLLSDVGYRLGPSWTKVGIEVELRVWDMIWVKLWVYFVDFGLEYLWIWCS